MSTSTHKDTALNIRIHRDLILTDSVFSSKHGYIFFLTRGVGRWEQMRRGGFGWCQLLIMRSCFNILKSKVGRGNTPWPSHFRRLWIKLKVRHWLPQTRQPASIPYCFSYLVQEWFPRERPSSARSDNLAATWCLADCRTCTPQADCGNTGRGPEITTESYSTPQADCGNTGRGPEITTESYSTPQADCGNTGPEITTESYSTPQTDCSNTGRGPEITTESYSTPQTDCSNTGRGLKLQQRVTALHRQTAVTLGLKLQQRVTALHRQTAVTLGVGLKLQQRVTALHRQTA